MAKSVQIRRGSSADHALFTGAYGELTLDTTIWSLRAHDGVTPGGKVISGGVVPPSTHNADYVPLWDGENTKKLKNGLKIGTGPNNLVKLDAWGQFPEINASALTSIDHKKMSNIGTISHDDIDKHIINKENPHNVDFSQILPILQAGKYLSNDGSSLHWTSSTGSLQLVEPPVTSTSYGTVGQIAVDSKYFYICVTESQWSKIPLMKKW